MKKLLFLAFLFPLAASAQVSILCAPATPCSSTTGPANTGTGDPAWKAFGKINENFTLIGSVTTPAFSAITSGTNTAAAMIVGAGSTLTSTAGGLISADDLNGATFASPGPIGSVTASSANFSSLGVTGSVNLTGITGSSQCLHVNTAGLVSGFGQDCSTGSGIVDVGTIGTLAYYPASTAEVASLAMGTGLAINSGNLVPVQVIHNVGSPAADTYTVLSSDAGKLLIFSDANPVNLLIPAASGAFGNGFAFDIENDGAGTITFTPTTSTVHGSASITIALNNSCSISSDGANYQVSACPALLSIPTFGTFATQNYATPPAIGGTTPAAGAFTTLSATGNLTTNVTGGGTVCLQASNTGVVSSSGAGCGGSGTGINIFSFASSTQAQATTNYDWYNQNAATAAGIGGISPLTGTLQHLYVFTTNAPAAANTYTATVYIGTAGSPSASIITCTIAAAAHTCNDTTHTASLTAAQQYNVQMVTSATSGSTGVIMWGLEYTNP